jgi:hypothetical protein
LVRCAGDRAGQRIAGVARCGCGKYRVEQLTITAASAGPELTAAPADPACYARVTASSNSERCGAPLVAS